MAVFNVIQLSDVRSGFRIDAGFYKEEYLEKEFLLSRLHTLPLWRIAKVTDGEHGSVSFLNNGIKYLTAEHIKQGFIDHTGARFVSRDVDQRNARARVREGDVLVSIKGTLGEIGLAEKGLLPANMNRDVAIIKPYPNSLLSAYLTAFLRSKYGAFQLSREGSGGVQQMITLERLKCVLIPLLNDDIQREIATIHQDGLSKREESVTLYVQAQQLLESELGLDKLNFQKPVGYSAQFSTVGLSDTFNAGRIDAQCFAPNAIFYQTWLRDYARCDRLSHLIQGMVKGRQQEETGSSSTDYCSIKHISGHELTDASKCQPTMDTPVADQDDLLLAITGATIGKIGIVKRYKQLAFSGDLLCLKANSEISPHYLLAALDHTIGQAQFNRWITGSTNGHLPPRDVGRVLVPRFKEGIEAGIVGLVEESLNKRVESEKLLNQAKTRVEQLIEEALAQ